MTLKRIKLFNTLAIAVSGPTAVGCAVFFILASSVAMMLLWAGLTGLNTYNFVKHLDHRKKIKLLEEAFSKSE